MRLAFFSPLAPQPSGIADYCEELLPHLASQGAEIELYVEGFTPASRELRERFHVFDYVSDPSCLRGLAERYDAVVYHMGNDHRYHAGLYEVAREAPGVIVLHDFALQDFFIGLARDRRDWNLYLDETEACHGPEARREAEEALARGGAPPQAAAPLLFPLNCRLARDAEGIIVHSEWSRERLREIAPATPVARVNHHITEEAARAAEEAAAKDGGGESDARDESFVRLASFGLVTPDKGIERALRVLSSLRAGHDFTYTLVGATNDFFDVRELVRRHRLEDRVSVTGPVSLAEFQRRMLETDIAINLRERTNGETSGSLCRLMAAGVATVVSNVGWFSELPDDSVVKIDTDGCADALLEAYLKRLIEDAPLRRRLGANARRHVLARHRIGQSAAGYLSFIAGVVAGRARRRFVGGVAAELVRLGLGGARDEALLRAVASEVAALAPETLRPGAAPAVLAAAATAASAASTLPAVEAPSEEGPGEVEEEEAHAAAANEEVEDVDDAPAHAEPPVEPTSDSIVEPSSTQAPPHLSGRLRPVEGIDYKRAAVEYPRKLDAERHHYLLTKPFYNLANKPPKHTGDGMDWETHRHFCDFANMAVALALPAGARLLDVGCGSGWLSEYFARLGYDVTGIDISPDLIALARERLARVPYRVDHETPLRCRFLVHDPELASLAEEFDAVLCYDTMHHFVDERAVVRHLARMTRMGGSLFILEGDRPAEGSAAEQELIDVMRRYETLESPFSPAYLRALLVEHGFAVVGDYVSANGLFHRDALEEGGLLRVELAPVNYLLCKKVTGEGGSAEDVPDSRRPNKLAARLTLESGWPTSARPGETVNAALLVENAGDTLWLEGPARRVGAVMLGARLLDEQGRVLEERHGEPPLPRAVAPGERVTLPIEFEAPREPGRYRLKLDLVAQHVAWFEQHGSEPLVLSFEVA